MMPFINLKAVKLYSPPRLAAAVVDLLIRHNFDVFLF
jgi:hypothetical protein